MPGKQGASSPMKVISSMKEFRKRFPNAPKKGERVNALERYFLLGGIIRAFDSGKEWPKLTYPNYLVLRRKLEELKEKRKLYSERHSAWKKSLESASKYHQTHQMKKLKEPLFWKHMAKVASDPDYRKDSEKVKLPAHLVGDPRWKPMVKMFVNDIEYRKQLTETVTTSIVYKKDKKVARYADELKKFRMDTSSKQLEELEKKIEEVDKTDRALREMQRWAKE